MKKSTRRGLVIIGFVLFPFMLGLLFTFEIIKINIPTNMSNQPSIDFFDSPIISPAYDSIPIHGQAIVLDKLPSNPIAADDVSIQRGEILYAIHCEICHGSDGRGHGPLAKYYPNQSTRDLTTPYVIAQFDGLIFRSISSGFGQMPSLGENLTPRERWDVVNYLRVIEGIPDG